MKFTLFLGLAATALAIPTPLTDSVTIDLSDRAAAKTNTTSPASGTGAITAATIPDFGVTAGVKSASQPGSCVGGNNVNIPCTCPPSKDTFAKTLATFAARGKAGNSPITFSTNFADQSTATNSQRISAMIISLQNLNFDTTGKAGVGCPAAAAPGFTKIQTSLKAGTAVKIGA